MGGEPEINQSMLLNESEKPDNLSDMVIDGFGRDESDILIIDDKRVEEDF